MTDWLFAAGAVAFLWLALTAVLSILAALCFPVFCRLGQNATAQARALSTLLYGVLAPLVSVLIVVLVLHPSLSDALVPYHCHGLNCHAHSPELAFQSSAGLIAVALTSLLIFAAVFTLQKRLRRSNRRFRVLAMLSTPANNGAYSLIDTPEPVAWCAGLVRPRVYLSHALVALLDDKPLKAVVLHEQAHAVRLDNLRRFILQLATLLWPPAMRRQLLRSFNDDTEQACDCDAAEQLGSTTPVITALQTLRTQTPNKQSSTAKQTRAFSAQSIDQRMQALQQTATPSHAPSQWLCLALFWVLPIVLLTGVSHQLVEWLLLS